MRTIWNGSISFGLVNIPVGLALATTPKAKQSDVSFRTLHRECKTPIRQKRWCPTHEREVGPDEIVKGWEVAKGEFVVVEDADLEAIAQHDDSRSIDITRFVPLDDVDPVYLDRTYYLAPAQAPAQRRPYVLLLEAMKQSGMGAIGRFVLRGGVLRTDPSEGRGARARDALPRRGRSLAGGDRRGSRRDRGQEGRARPRRQVMQSLVGEFEPVRAESQYRRELRRCWRRSSTARRSRSRSPSPDDARDRSHGGAQAERREVRAESGCPEEEAARRAGPSRARAPARVA